MAGDLSTTPYRQHWLLLLAACMVPVVIVYLLPGGRDMVCSFAGCPADADASAPWTVTAGVPVVSPGRYSDVTDQQIAAAGAVVQWETDPLVQIYCDVAKGQWQYGAAGTGGGSRSRRWRALSSAGRFSTAGAGSSSESSSGSGSAGRRAHQEGEQGEGAGQKGPSPAEAQRVQQLLQRMQAPQWRMNQDWIVRQYGWLQRQRLQHVAVTGTGGPPQLEETEGQGEGAADDADEEAEAPLYRPLRQIDLVGSIANHRDPTDPMSGTPGDASPAWAWPLTDLYPHPSFTAVGHNAAAAAAAALASGSGSGSGSGGEALAEYLRGVLEEGGKQPLQPIHGEFLAQYYVQQAAAAAEEAEQKRDATEPSHKRDSILYNASAQAWLPYVSPLLSFVLSQRSLQQLAAAEVRTIRRSMVRTCAALHAGWASRAQETAAEWAQWHRDRDCDVSTDYDAAVREGAYWQFEGSRRDRRAHGDAPHDSEGTGSQQGPQPRNASMPPPGMRQAFSELPRLLLRTIHVDVGESDAVALALADANAAAAAAGAPSPSPSPYSGYPLPHPDMVESYALHIDAATAGSADAATPAAAMVHVVSRTLWGAVRGLESAAQALEAWGAWPPGALGGRAGAADAAVLDTVTSVQMRESCVKEAEERLREASGSGGGEAADLSAPVDHAAALPIRLPLLVLDAPWRSWRGLSLDTARHWLPPHTILDILDGLSASKANVLHWHVSDAQSFPLRLSSHPELAEQGAWDANKTYTARDVHRIVRYAADRGIRVVPEIDQPAHSAAWGKSQPNVVVHCSSVGGGNLNNMDKFALDPTKEATFDLVRDVLTEMAGLFPDPFFHMGADEVVPECWASDAAVKGWAEAHLQPLLQAMPHERDKVYIALLTYFVHRVYSILTGEDGGGPAPPGAERGLGKRVMSWEDSFERIHNAGGGGHRRAAVPGAVPQPPQPQQPQQQVQQGREAQEEDDSGVTIRVPPLKYPPHAGIEGWKCWVSHADGSIAAGAADAARLAELSNYTDLGRGVLQAACWYLDWSVPWADMSRHWPLPERPAYMAALHNMALKLAAGTAAAAGVTPAAGSVTYPASLFAPHPYWGGEAAMWLERVDATNIECRIFPRAGTASEVMWSQSLAYDRYARQYGRDPPYSGAPPFGRDTDKLLALWGAPRHLMHTRRLIRRGIAASPVSVFDISTAPSSPLARIVQGAITAETEQWPMNGLCPGIEQIQQRPRERIEAFPALRDPASEVEVEDPADAADASDAATPSSTSSSSSSLRFVTYNIHDGGGHGPRYEGVISWLRDTDADVVGLVEASEWDVPKTLRRQRRAESASATDATAASDSSGQQRLRGSEQAVVEPDAGTSPRRMLSGGYDEEGQLLASVVAAEQQAAEQEEEEGGLSPGADELLYAANKSLASLLSHGRSVQAGDAAAATGTALTDQTAGFRRRAAMAGYTHSYLLRTGHGYHLALLSPWPITLVYQDKTRFERGMLVADIRGVRFILVHLHAQSAVERAKEAAWLASFIARYTAAGLPVVVMGDFNSLSPADHMCYHATHVVQQLLSGAVPPYLREKYLCDAAHDENCMGSTPPSPDHATLRIDYRPMHLVIGAVEPPMRDLLRQSAAVRSGGAVRPVNPDRDCPVSYPTAALSPDADDGPDNGHVPLRIDHALANVHALTAFPTLACTLGGAAVDVPESDPRSFAERVPHALLSLSDHLPLVCST